MIDDFIHMPIPRNMYTAVCALLGRGAIYADPPATSLQGRAQASQGLAPILAQSQLAANEAANTVEEVVTDRPDVDADGHPFDAALHTGTLTKAGLWRMKAGVSRPAPMPGFPKEIGGISTGDTGTESQAADIAPIAPATSTDDDDDEFAAFRTASEKISAVEEKAAAEIPARIWADADLGMLCNQAATKLGTPAPIKAIIEEFVAEGEVPHSRNIPADRREAFAKAVEAKAGITFAG